MFEYVVFAENIKTEEVLELGRFETAEDAWWNVHNNVEWDEGDVIEDWTFQVVESFVESEPYYNEDMGFDPYMGCYTDDC